MRMWIGVSPKILCQKHLCGEYRENYTIVGSLKKQVSISGYLVSNALELTSLNLRHKLLVNEMLRRGYHPEKPFHFDLKMADYLPKADINFKIDKAKNLKYLLEKCPECAARYKIYADKTEKRKARRIKRMEKHNG